MFPFDLILEVAAVAVLAGYLYLKHRQRMRRLYERYDAAEWTGKPIDVTKLKPGVEGVRRDYLAARPTARGIVFHRGLLGLARRSITQFAYFHDRESKETSPSGERQRHTGD